MAATSSGRGVALLLLGAPNREELLAQVDRLLAGAAVPAALPGAPVRLAIAAPHGALRDRLQRARSRLVELKRPSLFLRNQGIYLAADVGAPFRRRVAFLFPGQGSQHPAMVHELRAAVPSMRAWLAALDEAYRQAGRPAPSRLLAGAEAPGTAAEALFSLEQGAQLSTALNLALFELAGRLGVVADVLLGHSVGEHAAVLAATLPPGPVAAGRRQDICQELCRLGQEGITLEQPEPAEGMAAVGALSRTALAAIVARFPGELHLAMDNCPQQRVISGRQVAVARASDAIVAAGGVCVPLPFVRAYHSPFFAVCVGPLLAWYHRLQLAPAPPEGAALPVYSCLTQQPIPQEPAAAAAVMAAQWTKTVDFRATVEQLYAAGIDTFVEIGPDARLTAFVADILRGRPHLAVSISPPLAGSPHGGEAPQELAQLGHLLAALFAHGVPVEPTRYAALLAESAGGNPRLPALEEAIAVHRNLIGAATAAMAAVAARVQGPGSAVPPAPAPQGGWPLLGAQVSITAGRLAVARAFTLAHDPFLAGHSLGRGEPGQVGAAGTVRALPVLSFTTSLAFAAEAALRLHTGASRPPLPLPACELTAVQARRWLALDGDRLAVCAEAVPQGDGIQVSLWDAECPQASTHRTGPGLPAFQATFRPLPAHARPVAPAALRHTDPAATPPRHWDAAAFYAGYAFHGPCFQGLQQVLSVGDESIEAMVRVTELPGIQRRHLYLDPALLDCAGQLVAFWLLEQGRRAPTFGIFPVSVRRVVHSGEPLATGAPLRCRGRLRLERGGGLTMADVAFFAAGTQVVTVIEGLVQRLMEFPPALAAALFGGPAVDFSEPLPSPPGLARRQIDGEGWSLLAEGQGIWGRILAHMILHPHERAAWLALAPDVAAWQAHSRSVPLEAVGFDRWLLARLLVKETVRAWAGQTLARRLRLSAIECVPQPGVALAGTWQATGDDAAVPRLTVRLEAEATCLVATVEAAVGSGAPAEMAPALGGEGGWR